MKKDGFIFCAFILVLGISALFIGQVNNENKQLKQQVISLQEKLDISDARLKDVQNSLHEIDNEFSEYVYQTEQEKKVK